MKRIGQFVVERKSFILEGVEAEELVIKDCPHKGLHILVWCLNPFEQTTVKGQQNFLVYHQFEFGDEESREEARQKIEEQFRSKYIGSVETLAVTSEEESTDWWKKKALAGEDPIQLDNPINLES